MKLEIVHCGPYHRPETYVQELIFAHLGLVIGGLDYMKIRMPGSVGEFPVSTADLPFLSLMPAGLTIDFRFNRRRENWVIQCRMPELMPEPRSGGSLLQWHNGGELPIPLIRPVSMTEAFALRERFSRIGELHRSGTPADCAAAESMAIGIAGEFLAGNGVGENHAPSPAARVRALIDVDQQFRKTLAELSREAGVSPGHMRRLFQEEFRIAPGEYRARRRLGRIMELIDLNEHSLKEIAEEAGMRNVTHLHAFVRERCGVTPGELQKQRGKNRPVD